MSEALADETKRIITKVGTGIATVPPSADHRNGDWLETSIYDAELYMNVTDGKLYTANGGVIQSAISPFSIGELSDVDLTGLISGDVLQYDGADFVPVALPASANLGSSDLTSTDNNRIFTLNGSLVTNLLTIDTGAGTDIMQFRGNNTVYMPTGTFAQGAVAPSTDLFTSYTGSGSNVNFKIYNYSSSSDAISVVNRSGGIGFNGVVDSGVATVASFTNVSASGATNYGLKLNVANGTSNYALSIIAGDISLPNSGAGTMIGDATNALFAFHGATPIVQGTTAYGAATFVANTSGIVDDTATFDGYTIGQAIKYLRDKGFLA